jgi:hypothetical protein
MPNPSDAPQVDNRQKNGSSLHSLLLYVVGFGVILSLVMLAMAFGHSAVIFGVIVFVIAFAFIVHRYRFSLRTFLLVVTVLGVWLGLKLDRDVRMNRALSRIASNGGRLTVHDRRPNFPWGLWKHRYRLDFYGLEEKLAKQNFVHLEVLAPSSLQWLDLSNCGITDENMKSIEGHIHLEYLSLANRTYFSGEVIPDLPQNEITDAGLARLGNLRELKGIDLGGTDITDDGLKLLLAMPNLVWIYLDGTKVKGPGISYLRKHKHLMMLELNGCTILPIGYQELLQLRFLQSLGLRNSGTTDADLELLSGLSRLGILRLNKTEVSDEAVNRFQLSHPSCTIEH